MIRVTGLYCYPIKACRGVRVEESDVTRQGLARDRMLMLTDLDGQFLTQRAHPRLALVDVELVGDGLRVTGPEQEPIEFVPETTGDPQPVTIWSDTTQAVAQRADVNEWFSQYLGQPVQLVAMHEQAERRVDTAYARSPDDIVSFADGYSILLVSEASVEHLNSRLQQPVEMIRFRPNIVVSGCSPHAEDEWNELRIGGLRAAAVKPCARCSVITVNPQTAETNREPTATLAGYRRSSAGVLFGMNLVHEVPGLVRVGDEVQVLSTRSGVRPGTD